MSELELNRNYKYIQGELGEGYSRKIPLGYLYVGIVKDTNDAHKMGRIKVWIPELGGNPEDPSTWVICSCVSPFAGTTPVTSLVKDSAEYTQSQQSYGFVAQPPHVGNLVVVAFINGSPNFCVYLGFLFHDYMNHGIPGLSQSNVPGSREKRPSVEYNRYRTNPVPEDPNIVRPEFKPLSKSLKNQGLELDEIRGTTDASMRRESPPNVYGLITPRGHHIYIDDGKLLSNENISGILREENTNDISRRLDKFSQEYIRIRTRNGVQILINDTDGYIYFISREGNSWMEISDTEFNIYSKENVNIRSEKNINIHCDGNFNLFSNTSINQATDGTIRILSKGDTNIKSEQKLRINSDSILSIKSNGLIAIDGQPIRMNQNLAEISEIPIVLELSDIDSESKSFVKTRTIVSQLVHHEPFGHGFRDKTNDFVRPPRGQTINTQDTPDPTPNSSDYLDISDLNIGSCAQREESGGNPAVINDNDVGYPSYGLAQIRAAPGSNGMQAYLNLTREKYPAIYQRLEAAGGVNGAIRGTPEFKAAWRSLASDPSTRQQFIESQKVIVLSRWYKPTLERIKAEIGEDFSQRSAGIKDMVYSLGVQHGPAGGARVVRNALQGRDIKTLTDEEILRLVYEERGSVDQNGILKYFPSYSAQVGAVNARNILRARYSRELNCNLNKTRADLARRNISPDPFNF
ncbi:MAG: phage baseplate assembly protein V [Candidatus Dojkabacteria bacterium]|nr:phage baseplate assembly protein V [Candidatus Dojkabacteria bacterium]